MKISKSTTYLFEHFVRYESAMGRRSAKNLLIQVEPAELLQQVLNAVVDEQRLQFVLPGSCSRLPVRVR